MCGDIYAARFSPGKRASKRAGKRAGKRTTKSPLNGGQRAGKRTTKSPLNGGLNVRLWRRAYISAMIASMIAMPQRLQVFSIINPFHLLADQQYSARLLSTCQF